MEDFSEHSGIWRRLQWEIRWCGRDGPPMRAYRLQVTGTHLDSAEDPKALVLAYLQEALWRETYVPLK